MTKKTSAAIGIFDSGYGGLTILNEIRKILPKYDFLYLGDNARTPYGTRSFDVVYRFTLQCVQYLFEQGCRLVILACNTASAKALRTIQQNNLPHIDPNRRVLGVIRPTVEALGSITKTAHVGIFGTIGTIDSQSYPIEIAKLFPHIKVHSTPCPMWVPLIENNEHKGAGADYFVKKYVQQLLQKNQQIDTIVLGCTHYPLITNKIEKELPENIRIVSQGHIVAHSLAAYLKRHPEMDEKCSKNGQTKYLTTENPEKFAASASIFLNEQIDVSHAHIE